MAVDVKRKDVDLKRIKKFASFQKLSFAAVTRQIFLLFIIVNYYADKVANLLFN